jgi:hypothetical protein
MPNQMTLDEKTCWNPTWIVMDIVAYTLGYFLKGGPNENNDSPQVPKNCNHSFMIFIKFIYIWKAKMNKFLVVPSPPPSLQNYCPL